MPIFIYVRQKFKGQVFIMRALCS